LKKLDPYFDAPNIRCWEMPVANITIYVFSIELADETMLLAEYRPARDHIAVSFQGQTLDSDAERWNLYLFYFVGGEVSGETKQLIEQDKFSSRKTVLSGFTKPLSDEQIAKQLNDELFHFEIQKRKPAANSLDKLLAREHPAALKALKQLKTADTRDALGPLLKILNDEQN